MFAFFVAISALARGCLEAQREFAAGMAVQITKFSCKCPAPEQCGRSGKLGRRGGFFTERRARQSLYDHLIGAPAHHWSHTDSTEAADSAEVFENTSGGDAEDADRRAEQDDSACWYDQPGAEQYAPPRDMIRGGDHDRDSPRPTRRRRLTDSAGNEPAASAVAHVQQDLGHQIATQTRNAYVFVKAMTKAQSALTAAARLARSAYQTFEASIQA